jgi:putative glycosyltransferase (TIGR04372 family)
MSDLFKPLSENQFFKSYERAGYSSERPFKFFVYLAALSYGDFLASIITASKIASRFAYSEATFMIVPNRPYKTTLLQLYPYPFRVVSVKDDRALQFVNFDITRYDKTRRTESIHWQDFLVPPQYSGEICWSGMGSHYLRVPEDKAEGFQRDLLEAGLDPDRWFCVMHYREPNYRWKSAPNLRDVDPATYNSLVDYVIDELGGQIVRLGHPEMVEVPPRSGFVDLSRHAESYLLQSYACSRARFYIGSATGSVVMALAFNTPNLIADASDFWDGAPGRETYLLTHTVRLPDGRRLRQESLAATDLLSTFHLTERMRKYPEITLEKATAPELHACARFMLDKTADCEGWRTPSGRPEPDFSFKWPPVQDWACRYIPISDLVKAH